MSESRKIAEALQSGMVRGKRYSVSDLIELLPLTNYKFSDESKTPIPTEPGRPKWNRWVRNTVRNSPDMSGIPTSWWTELRAEHVGPKKADWEYWIEGGEEQSRDIAEFGGSNRPLQNDGWLAEQRVKKWLTNNGWESYDVSREGFGYDVLARKGDIEIYVEVKSSTSKLSITLTRNEWETALIKKDDYFIAYFENFDSDSKEEPRWIKGPYKMTPVEREITEYSLPRSQWSSNS